MGAWVPNSANADLQNMEIKSTKYGSNLLLSTHARLIMLGFSWKWGIASGLEIWSTQVCRLWSQGLALPSMRGLILGFDRLGLAVQDDPGV